MYKCSFFQKSTVSSVCRYVRKRKDKQCYDALHGADTPTTSPKVHVYVAPIPTSGKLCVLNFCLLVRSSNWGQYSDFYRQTDRDAPSPGKFVGTFVSYLTPNNLYECKYKCKVYILSGWPVPLSAFFKVEVPFSLICLEKHTCLCLSAWMWRIVPLGCFPGGFTYVTYSLYSNPGSLACLWKVECASQRYYM